MSVLLFAAVVQATALVGLHWVFVTRARGQYVDAVSLAGASIGFRHIDDLVYAVLDVVSVATVIAGIVLIGVVALVRRRFVLAAATAILVVGANVTTQVLKRLVLDRPDLVDLYPGEVVGSVNNTMPSGHTTVAMSVAVAFVLVVPGRVRGLVAVLATGYAAVTGVGTLAARWHRPSDVVAACCVVGLWAAVVGAFAVAKKVPRRTARDSAGRAVPFLAVVGVLLLAAGAGCLALTWMTDPSGIGRTAHFVAYAGGAAGIAGSCAVVMAGVLAFAPWLAPERTGRAAKVEARRDPVAG